ncbi:phosphatidylserine decarboxylase-domain-containing protein [Halenospora varia]|nr:phosphatidylserine decarboxylase-domain-containing protein [Halenospora varia]
MPQKCGSSDPPPFPLPAAIDPWIQSSLVVGVLQNDTTPLNQAVKYALAQNIPQMQDWGVIDSNSFLLFASGMMNWTPSETCNGKMIYWTLCLFYFILDQPPLNGPPLSTPIIPTSIGQSLLPLSQWVVDFATKVGAYMDTQGSISQQSIETFQNSPKYNYDEVAVPTGGFTSFNQLFSRFLKPGMRPISCPSDDRVVVYPADSTFDGAWGINQNDVVTIKGLSWSVNDLLAGSQYASKFIGGQWMHAFLNTFDYHRQHAPVGGTVVEANVIQGQAYLNVQADPDGTLRQQRSFIGDQLDAPDNAGYQFLQSRGCVIIQSDTLGYVAVLPIGMAQVSSVKLAWEPPAGGSYPINPNVPIKKGDEISHFEFGGSDIVLVFQADAYIQILGAQGVDGDGNATSKQKYLVGMPLGFATK